LAILFSPFEEFYFARLNGVCEWHTCPVDGRHELGKDLTEKTIPLAPVKGIDNFEVEFFIYVDAYTMSRLFSWQW
jgi:hypothetical protein